jgi:DeoR family transcriptional regulator, suf operon transcriptional repressor
MMQRAPTVSPGRRGVLDALKRDGRATVDELAERLGITVAGTRQHLAALVDEGLVASREVGRTGGERGRPRLVYELTARTEPLFPKAYDELANELLRHVAAEGDGLVGKVFERRRDGRIAAARRRLEGRTTLEARVAELTRILDEDGYLAEWQALDEGRFLIVEHNCAILVVAQGHPDACRSEIEFLQAVLPGATVERISHIVAGAHQCGYLVSPAALTGT